MPQSSQNPFAVFRADASNSIGGGHIMRCLALADALSSKGWKCAFACQEETLSVMPALVASIHQIGRPKNLSTDWPEGCDLLVVDHYGLDATFESSCRPWAKRILVIDDLADRNHDCDILVDQTFGRRLKDYSRHVPSSCLTLTGSHYALLRPQFARARHRALNLRTDAVAERILISLGVADNSMVVNKILDGIGACKINFSLDVIGAEKRSIPGVTFHNLVENMAKLMCSADIAIGAGGISTWERCCLGLPSIIINTTANQKLIVQNLRKAGAAIDVGGGATVTADQITQNISALALDGPRRNAMARKAAIICDGLGTSRVVMAITPGLSRDGRSVRLSPATLAHGNIMFEWQTAPGIRCYSRNPEPPKRNQHFPWLERKLANPHCVFSMVLCDEKPAGIIRLEHSERLDKNFEAYEVSVLIAPDYQGMGLAKIALKQAQDLLPYARLTAAIHYDNDASKNLFLGSGYTSMGGGYFEKKPL